MKHESLWTESRHEEQCTDSQSGYTYTDALHKQLTVFNHQEDSKMKSQLRFPLSTSRKYTYSNTGPTLPSRRGVAHEIRNRINLKLLKVL